MDDNVDGQNIIEKFNELSEPTQQIVSDILRLISASNNIKDYIKIIKILNQDQYKHILEEIYLESSINLYQVSVLDVLLPWYKAIRSDISKDNTNKSKLLNLFKKLLEEVKSHKLSFNDLQKPIPEFNDFNTFSNCVEVTYFAVLHSEHINLAKGRDRLQTILSSLENKKHILEFIPEGSSNQLTAYKRLILKVLEKAVLLRNKLEGNESNEENDISIEWLSSKFDTYAYLFEGIPRDQLPFDYNNSKLLFKVRYELTLLTLRLQESQNQEAIEEVLILLEKHRTKYRSDIEELNNELFFYYDLILNATLNKAIDAYNKISEKLSIDQSLELLKKLLDNFEPTKVSSSQNHMKEEWAEAISGYHHLRSKLAKNYYYLQFKNILLSEEKDPNAIESLLTEIKDIQDMELDENELYNIIGLYKIDAIKDIDNLERILSFIDVCKPILDKYVADTGLSAYPILLSSAIGRFIRIDIEDIIANNKFSLQLAKYTGFFKSLNIELFPKDAQLFLKELKNYGAIIAINESILDKLVEQLKSSEITVNEEETAYNGQVDLTILSDQIALFRELIDLYDSFSLDIKEIIHESLKKIVVISAGNFDQILVNKHNAALNAVIKVLFIIDAHLQRNPIEDFDNHFAMKICGHITHSLYYLKEGEDENTISTEYWLKLADSVLLCIKRNGIENYHTVINYKGDLYRNLKSIYTIQPPREHYISDDSNSITHQLYKQVNEIIALKSEFTVGALAPLEERKKNIPLRALACMVKGDISQLTNVENILVQITGEEQVDLVKMVINSLMMSDGWQRVISIVENTGLVHLKDEVILFYVCAKINLKISLTEDEIQYYREESSDLESIFLAEVFINIRDYDNAIFQLTKIKLETLDQNNINYTLLLLDRFCHIFLYSKEGIDLNTSGRILFDSNEMISIEAIYNKFVPIELLLGLKLQLHYRLLKLSLYANDNKKINELIRTLSSSEEKLIEYRDVITKHDKLHEEQKANLVVLLRTCQHELTLEEAIYAKALFQELAEASIEKDQITRDKSNKIVLVNEISIEQKLDGFGKQDPEKKDKTFSKPIFSEIKEAIKSLEPKHLMNLKSSIVQTDHYHIDVALVPGTTNIFKLEIQGKNRDGIDNQTVAQVIYDPLMLDGDLEIIGNQIISLLIKAANFSNKPEVGRYYCREYDLRKATQFEISHRGSLLQAQKTSLDYMFDYNELALKNLLELRLKSAIEDDKLLKGIKVLGAKIIDIHHNVMSAHNKIISLSNGIASLYKDNKDTKYILVPILVPKNSLVYHWVGLIITKEDNGLSIVYIDSENHKDIALLQTLFTYHLQELLPYLHVSFKQISVEQQKYNNCGLELIENFVYFLSEKRADQEIAPYLHSELYVQNLIIEYYEQNSRDIGTTNIPLYVSKQAVINGIIESDFYFIPDTIKYIQNECDSEYESWFYQLESLINLNLSWKLKKFFYFKDIMKFNQLMQKYNTERSVDELQDLEPYSFSIELDDKELEKDILFVAQLKEKLNLPIGAKEIEYLQPIIYKANIAFKVSDTIVSTTRVIYIPTIDNAQKVLMDAAYVYAMYKGINGISLIPIGYEAIVKYQQIGLSQTLIDMEQQVLTIASYMLLPTMIGLIDIPYIGFCYSVGLLAYSGYNALANGYFIYNEFNQKDFYLNSKLAHRNLAEILSTTPLQHVYDFLSKAKEYEKEIYKLQLEEKGEFGQKLYEYIYFPIIEEKYEILNKLKQGVITEEESKQIKSKNIQVIHYDFCKEVLELKKEEKTDHYYCYDEEQQTLDHIIIIGEGYIEKICSLEMS